jgi:hypothetical protein
LTLAAAAAWAAPAPCSEQELAKLLESAAVRPAVSLTCSALLKPTDVIQKRVVIRGSAASGLVLDCRGATLRNGLLILSRQTGESGAGAWDRPERITVRNCVIEGHLRVSGMAINGEALPLRDSSRAPGHTERAQNAAPRNILLENLSIRARGNIALYVSPGVTRLTLGNSTITGRTRSVAIYLDTESAGNTISGNTIEAELGREAIAVDGSAYNLISDNIIRTSSTRQPGGIFLYRNCGQGGTIRHQTPHSNAIVGNDFFVAPAIWVASRNGNRRYCGADDGYPFGSSASNLDHAQNTVILGNHFLEIKSRDILKINDGPTLVQENRIVDPAFATDPPPFSRFVAVGAKQPPVLLQNDVGPGKRTRSGLSCFEPEKLPALRVVKSGETRAIASRDPRCPSRTLICKDGELALMPDACDAR